GVPSMTVKFTQLEKLEHYIDICGRCGDCSTSGTQMSTAKRHVDRPCPVKNVLGYEAYSARGRIMVLKNVLGGKLKINKEMLDWAYSCTTCASCKETCLAIDGGIDTPAMMEALRSDLVESGNVLGKHKEVIDSIVENGNPYGEPAAKRLDFIKGRHATAKADVLLFLGCTASYREPAMAAGAVALLDKLGVPYAMLDGEGCCGSILKRYGYSTEFASNARRVVDAFAAAGAKTIVTPCAGCYRTFKKDYAGVEGASNFQFKHVTEFANDLLKANPREFKLKQHARISYHDPCHLGRHAGVYEAPRDLLKGIQNATFVELDASRNFSHCCGSGGGVKSSNPELAREIATNRDEEAIAKQVDILVSACPFCERNLRDGLDGASSKLRVADVTELLAETMVEALEGTVAGCGAPGDATTAGGRYMAYLARYPDIFSDLVQGSVMDFTIYEKIDDLQAECDPIEAFNVLRTERGIDIRPGRADSADLELALAVAAVEKLVTCPTKASYAEQFGRFYNEPDEAAGWIDFVLNKRTKTLIKMGYGKFAEAAGILEDDDAV
ncbi:MAG: (Fe-S)-binding protein, partial [Candidatus Lokiarchaeota archaeon]|nr:(Fe-S)-binding protein [Candidatus Lokiarchaeota archaeon]